MEHSVDQPTRGWWAVVERGDDLKGHYLASHLTEAGITVYKAYVRASTGGIRETDGEVVELAAQGARIYNEQSGSPHSQRVKAISDTSSTAYSAYTGGQDLATYGQFMTDVYRIKKSGGAETMIDAVQAAETTEDGVDGDLKQLALSGAFLPFEDASAGLKITAKQSLFVYQWSDMQKPTLARLSELAAKREAGTITPQEMRVYYVLQMGFHGSGAQMSDSVAALQRKGREGSYAFRAVSNLRNDGNLADQMERSGDSFRLLKNLKMEQMAEFEMRTADLTESSVNIAGDPDTDPVLRPEPLSVNGPGRTR
jgi:hypothetical protein